MELMAAEGVDEVRRGLQRDGQARRSIVVGEGSEGVGASGEHGLSEVVGVGESSDSEVAEHGVGLPAADELDGVGVDVGAEERGGAARTEAAGGELVWVDACVRHQLAGGVLQGVGDQPRSGIAALPTAIPEGVDGSCRRGVVRPEMRADACKGFARAKLGVVGGLVRDLLAADGVLLSENVSVALVIGPVVVSSFKEESEAATRREPRVKVMSWRRKASERPSPSP